jgi:uncharacterized membrane protein YfcA
MIKLILIAAAGAFAQFVDGAMGMGYGTTAASVLIAAGFLPVMISASIHTAEVFTSLASSASHLQLGNVDKSIALPLTISGVVGGVIGAYILASLVSSFDMTPLVAGVLLLLGIRILFKSLRGKLASGQTRKSSKRLLLPLGFVAGAVDAIGGGGWGPISTSTLITGNRTAPRYVIGSVNLAEFFVTVSITITFGLTLGFENFPWQIILPMVIGGVLIAPVAAYASSRVSATFIGVAVGLLLVALNVNTVSQSLSDTLGFPLPSYFDILILVLVGLTVILLIIGLLSRRGTSPESLGVGSDD